MGTEERQKAEDKFEEIHESLCNAAWELKFLSEIMDSSSSGSIEFSSDAKSGFSSMLEKLSRVIISAADEVETLGLEKDSKA